MKLEHQNSRLFMDPGRILFRCLVLSLIILPAACTVAPTPQPTSTPMPLAKELIFYDWEEDMPQSVLDAFTQKYGVQVRYLVYESQEEAIENMRAGEVYDVVVMESRYVPLLVQDGLLAELHVENLSNLKNISPNFRELAYDPENQYTVAYNWGTTGLVVRSDLVEEPQPVATFILPLLFAGFLLSGFGIATWFLLIFVFYFITYFVVIFFNTALIAAAHIRLSGGDPTVRDGLSHAGRHLGGIAAWALISATVGLVLSALRNRGGAAGSLASGILGIAWSLLTFFVIPVMIFEEKGVIDSIKESMGLFRKTWGENIVGSIGLGLVMIPVILVLFLLMGAVFTGSTLFLPLAAFFVLLLGVTAVVYSDAVPR